ncbi:synthesis of cytochrome c oxidase [Megachile rotundata]|uniref:synthesis of cytochrome c oxidase n=1 Tax=Megachile rotundata TaxID=143995 RepID=UPI000258DD87|nr:PREDICTED: protein SCO1 homolog, mitochondrial [Megachile rotundata]
MMLKLMNQSTMLLNRTSIQILKKNFQNYKQYYPQVRCINTSAKFYQSNNIGSLPSRKKPVAKSPFSWKNTIITTILGTGLVMYLYYLQDMKDKELDRQRRRELGKAAIGGTFELVDPEGKTVKSLDFLGKWLLIYFGFTHCPDVCPDEIEKMTKIVDILEKEHNIKVQPLFISVDPDRDTPEIVGKYIKEFSDKIIGLTGTQEQVAKVTKAYRVYYSNGPKDQDSDYIVDHTIIIYLIDPDGLFVDYYGQTHSAEQVSQSVIINKMKYDKLKSDSWTPSISLKNPLPA